MLLVFFIIFFLMLLISIKVSVEIVWNGVYEVGEKSDTKKIFLIVKVFLIGNIKVFQKRIDKEKLSKIFEKSKIINFNKKQIITKLKQYKISKIKLHDLIIFEKFKLNLKLGTGENILVIMIIPILSTILSTFISKSDNVKYSKYKILPIFDEGPIINIYLDCIISLKLIHIINVIWKKMKREGDKYGRTSNRSTYAYGNE